VLIAWEFGSGLGHLAAMHPIISALRERGCEPLVAVPDPDLAREILGADAPRLIRSVVLPQPRRRVRPPESFADLLSQRGFSSPTLLEGAVDGWRRIYLEERIESVLLDFAPVAQLAAWTLSLAMTGCSMSFAHPPVPIPGFRPGNAQSDRLAQEGEKRLLSSVEGIARRFGRTTGGDLAVWLHAPHAFTRGIREMNVYDFEPPGGYLGPLGLLPGLQPIEWHGNRRQRVLCYLRWSPQLPSIIVAMTGPERELICVAPGAPPEWCASQDPEEIRVAPCRVSIRHLITGSDLVVSHGSAGVACEALIAGKPQLMMPIDWEKLLTARTLEKLGVARVISHLRFTGKDEFAPVRVSELTARARQFAAELRQEPWSATFAKMIEGA
jgi:hypothetical protein